MSSQNNKSQDKILEKDQKQNGDEIVEDIQVDKNSSRGKINSSDPHDAALNGTEQALQEKSQPEQNGQQVINLDEEEGLIQKTDAGKKQTEIEMQKLKDEDDKEKKADKFEQALKDDDGEPTDMGRTSTKGKGTTKGGKDQKGGKDTKGGKDAKGGKDQKGGKDAKGGKDQVNQQGQISNQPSLVKKQVQAKVKQNTYEQQKALQKQFRQKQLELKKNEGQQAQLQKSGFSLKNLLKDNLFIRKSWRMFLLVLIAAAIVTLLLVFYYHVGFVRGSKILGNNEKVVMNINSCTMMVYDQSLRDSQVLDTNFLKGTLSEPSSLASDENIYMQYIYPDAPVQEHNSKFEYSEENGVKTYTFDNQLNHYECEIVLYVFKETSFEQFDIQCGDTHQCNLIFYSKSFSAKKMNIKGVNVQMNAPELKVDSFVYESQKGQIEIPYFTFNDADIKTREGDVSIQSSKDIDLTFYQKDPYNCLSAKNIKTAANVDFADLQAYQQSITKKTGTDCKTVYPWGLSAEAQTEDKIIEYRCYEGKAKLVNLNSGFSTLKVENSFGNINVNVIASQGQFAKEAGTNKVKVYFNKAGTEDDQKNNLDINFINFSSQSKIDLFNQTKSASNPKVYDPIFVFNMGPKFTRSSTFQQVQFTYNPAYTYMKPYWLGELTLTLMTTEKYTGQYTISPGFCPYVPSMNLERIHKTQSMVSSFMQANKAPEYAVASNAWQPNLSYPTQKFVDSESYYGFKDISLNRKNDEEWIGIDEDQAKNYSVVNYDVSYSSSLYAAIIVSCILSGILGVIFMVILVFAINQNYIWVLNHISSVRKYSVLEKGGAGEIDESTLDIQKRRFYIEYKEQQQLMEDQNKKLLQESGENPEQEEKGFVPKYTITSIFSLFYQLIYLSPPLSAFIDYIVLLLHKAKQNSISEFYKLLFRPKKLKELKENDDEEIHSLEKDSIQGNEMKQLYEKFCYLNQYLERKFDDEENMKFLTEKGFKIIARHDAQTQYFTYVKYNGNIPTVPEQPNKTSLDLFISTCCSLTKFDTDRIESTELDNVYQEFCILNHMQKIQLNEGALKRDYGIQTIYLPQQWVERDEKFDVQKNKKKFFIDKKRVENNFKILLAKDSFLFNMLYDTEDYKQSQRDIQVPTGWQFFDMITVVAHVLTMTLLGSPLILLAIFIRTQQSTYSLLPPMRLIYHDTILYYPTSIPAKLIDDNWIVMAITIITIVFWCLSFWDLIYYYASMDFPQEKYFNEYKLASRFRKFLSGLMWIIVLISSYTFAVYLSLVAIWLMLSAIINPNAFLPYATSAATFVTLVTKKYKEFQEISQNGFKILSDYLSQLATGQFQDLLKKMNIQDKIADLVPTDTLKDITAEASKLGIIDPAMCEDIQNNLEIMIRDPASVAKLGQELAKISEDPMAFAASMSQKLEEKAKAIILQQVGAIDKDLREELVNLFWCLLKSQKSELKNAISSFVNAIINVFQRKQGKQLLKSLGFLNLKGPVFDFIWEFAFPVENFKGNYQDHLTNVFCVALSNIITVWNKQLKSIVMTDQQVTSKKAADQKENKEKGGKKNKKQQAEKSEQQILKEKLMKELEKAEAVIQADAGQEEEQEIELTSEEAISFAYKNIIFSVIQICRAINSGNSEVILNQILNLVKNTSKLPGFEGLNQVQQYQDIFKLGYAIFKNDGEVDYEDVSAAFKSFLKNTGLEDEVKDIAGVGILDVLKIVEVIIQSFKNQSKQESSNEIKKAISNLIGSIDFVNKRSMLRNQEFKDVNQMTSTDECQKMIDDVTLNLNETKTNIANLDQQRLKAKQNEDYYKNKLENSLQDLKDKWREFLYMKIEDCEDKKAEHEQKKAEYEQKNPESKYPDFKDDYAELTYDQVDEITNVSGEKVIYELEKILDEIKKLSIDRNKQYTKEKADVMKEFAELKKEKADQQEKLNVLNVKIDPIKTVIKKNLDEKIKERTKLENSKEQEIAKYREKIKDKQKTITNHKQNINQANIKLKEKELVKKRALEKLKECEDNLNKNQIGDDGEGNAYVPSEGDINELLNTKIHIRNPYFLDHNEEEEGLVQPEDVQIQEKKKDKKEEEQEELFKEIRQCQHDLREIETQMTQLRLEIESNEKSIKLQEADIKEIEDTDIADIERRFVKDSDQLNKKFALTKEEDELQVLQEEYEKEKQKYEEIVSQISENMKVQEDIEEDVKENENETNDFLKNTQIYMDDYKSSQKQLNKVYQDKIEYHDKIDDLTEKKQKFESYIVELEEKFKRMSEELKDRKKEQEEEEKKRAKQEAQIKEDNNNFIASGITIMLNIFSGQISNLQPDLIKELGSFFNLISQSDFIQDDFVKKMFSFLKNQILEEGEEKGKANTKAKEKINSAQSLLNLMDIFLNDTSIAATKIGKNGIDNCQFEDEVAKSLQILLTCRFDGIAQLKSINNHLKGSDLLELISKVMKMKEDAILGFMELILGFKTSNDVHIFVNFAASLNKIKENKVPTMIHLYNLYSSKSPSELFDALTFFKVTQNVPKEFENVTIKDLVLAIQFMRGGIDFSLAQTIIEEKLKLPPQKDREQNPKIQLEIKERMKYNLELPSHFKKILEIEHRGYLQSNILQTEFKDINRNFDILLDQADFNFFKKFASIRNIPRIEDPSQNTLVKSSITDISEMLNIDYFSIEFFINLLTSSKSGKISQALHTLQIQKINPKCDKNDISNFADFTSSILEKIEQRNQNINNISKYIFSDKLPQFMLKKILFHEGTIIPFQDYLELFSIYSNNATPKSILNLIDFRVGISGNKKKDIYKLLHPLKDKFNEDEYKQYKKKQDGQYGLMKAVQILTINDQTQRIQTFLQYLIKSKQEALLMTSCLLVYFSGRSNNIQLVIQDQSADKKQKKVSVEQLLCQLLQVKQEFFEAVHTYFQEDTNQCTQTMIKFYRQLDYLNQQAEGDSVVLENNITISDKNVEQYVRLVNHMQMNTSFISKESNIPIEAVELISTLMQIKIAKDESERSAIFEQMRNNSYIIKLFQQLGVNHQELVTLIKLMYQDYEPTNIKWISKSLKLPSNFKIDGLQQLIMIDQVLPIYGESNSNKKNLINLIKTNKFIKNFKVNTTWAEIAYILSKGDFCLLSKYQDKLLPLKYPSAIRYETVIDYSELKQARTLTQAVNAKEIKYISLIQGLTGLLSCRQASFQTTEFLYQLYTIISQKYLKDEHITIEDGLKKGNTLQYAIYKFTKSTLMSPVWTLLMMGDFNTWEYLAQSHYLVNNNKNYYLNPILALVYVLNFRSNPLIVKQLLVDFEYAQRSYQIYIAKLRKDCMKRIKANLKKQNNEYYEEGDSEDEIDDILLKDIKKKTKQGTTKGQEDIKIELNEEEKATLESYEEKIKNFRIQINNLLLNCIEKDGEKLIHMAEDFNFPKKVINMLLIYEHEYGEKKKKDDDDNDDIEEEEDQDKDKRLTTDLVYKAFAPLEKDMESEDNKKKYGEYKELEILYQVFEYVGTDFYTDPRREKFDQKQEEKNFTKNYCLFTHSSSPLMQMSVLSTIAQLKLSYFDFYGFNQRDEEHYKQVTYAIDLILCTLEKYYYFDDMMDFFPRHRLIPLIGLSVGFVIESDDIFCSVTSSNVFNQRYFTDVIVELCQKVYDRQNDDEYNNEDDQKQDKNKFQKYIELSKFKLKYKYFESMLINYYLTYQVEYNSGYQGPFKGINQYEIQSELEKKNLERLIDNYDEMMWDTSTGDELLLHLSDPKTYSTYTKRSYYYSRDSYDQMDYFSGEKYKDLFEYIDEYSQTAESENFRLLVDVYKENYRSLSGNDHFQVTYGQDSNMYYGMLLLNGIISQQQREFKMEDFQACITSTSLYMTSNKKALAEILSLLIPSLKTSFSSLQEQLNVQEEVMTSFINLAMGKSINQSHDLDNLLKKSSLSDANREAMKNCVWAYQGEMREHLSLIHHSPLFQASNRATVCFTKFLWSFEKSSMHKSSNNPYEINYFDFCNLSPNRGKALEKAQQYLWKISLFLCYQKWLSDDKSRDRENKANSLENFKIQNIYRGNNKISDNQMSLLLQKILYNDWNFLITNEKNTLQSAFDVIFNVKPEVKCLEKIHLLSLIKPQRCNLKLPAGNLDDHINCSNVREMVNNGGEMFENPSEAKHLQMLFALANNSTVHILNYLNTSDEEWNFDYQEEQEEEKLDKKMVDYIKENKYDPESKEQDIQDTMFQKYNALKKEALAEIRNNIQKEEKEGISRNKYLSYILQSLFLWKNISNIQWDNIFKNSEAFILSPYQFKDFKRQIDFLFNYIEYLSILPAVILDKAGAKPAPSKKVDVRKLQALKPQEAPKDNVIVEETNVFRVLKTMKYRSLDTEIFTRHISGESNSIYLIYQSYEKIVTYMSKIAEEYSAICEDDEEIRNDTFKETLKNRICDVSEDIYFMLNFLNGSFLKEIEKSHPLIEYLSNLYFKGLQAIHTSKTEPITQYLNDCMISETSFIKTILKEIPDYATIFNQVLNIIFTISFCTMNDAKIDRLEKENILNQIDELLYTVGRDLLQVDDNIVNLIYAVFYLITNQETKKMKENAKLKDKQNCLIILLKIAFENPDLSEFFFGSAKGGEGVADQVDKMINTMTSILQSILDKPSQSINDNDLVKEVLKLIKYASKGTIDVTIIEDIISILTGDHQRVFNILKKFEIVDENKIALIQRAYNQVADMPIFSSKDKAITAGGGQGEQSDKIKDIVKKLQDGKATIKDVFIAVDAEGDSSGTISIDEFQSFVRRLGMELSRHRVNEIFAFIKNKKIKQGSGEKSEELTLNVEEFEKAFKYVNDKKTSMSLEKLGISPALLVLALGTLIVILILLFIFIFLGINAFAVGGTFGSIINSIIPMAAAGGAAGSQEEKKDKLKEEEISNAVSETQSIIHSDHL